MVVCVRAGCGERESEREQGGTKKGTRQSFFFPSLKENQKKNKACTEGSFSMSVYFPKFCSTTVSSTALIQILRDAEACIAV